MKNFTQTLKTPIFLFALLTVPSVFAQSVANYDVSITTIWNTTDHTSVPGNAHWSDLIGATHNTENEFVDLGVLATLGIKNVAEGGDNGAITNEINSVITAGRADQLLQDDFPFAAVSTAGFTGLQVSEDFPFITLVSMVAPSPDWFIAVNSLNLRSGNNAINNGWKDTFTLDVFAYDSGTDSGTNYTSSDNPNAPVPVFMITGFPINGNKMATITFTYNSSTLSVENFNSVKKVEIYPNPSYGIVNIKTSGANSVALASMYDVLGKRVGNFKNITQSENFKINTSNFKGGIYVLKLSLSDGSIVSRKLILN